MNRPLLASLMIVTAAFAADALAAPPVGGVPRQPLQADPLGPRSEPTVTVAQAVARTQIERSGYTGVRGLQRGADGSWHGMARNAGNTPVSVTLDGQGKVSETR
jgi:hypothetical protein